MSDAYNEGLCAPKGARCPYRDRERSTQWTAGRDRARKLAQIARNETTIKRPALNYHLHMRHDGEWQVRHGNKIVERYSGPDAETRANAQVRILMRGGDGETS